MAYDVGIVVKEEPVNPIDISEPGVQRDFIQPPSVIELSSSESESDLCSTADEDEGAAVACSSKRTRETVGVDRKNKRKKKADEVGVALPPGLLYPLPLQKRQLTLTSSAPARVLPHLALPPARVLPHLALPPASMRPHLALPPAAQSNSIVDVSNKQFWKAGDYEEAPGGHWSSNGGMDHGRVHPRFLHSNATSHKWVLGAFAELLDNALDEVCNGATRVTVDMVKNKKDDGKMLLIEDNGGGMNPDKMRHCMSLGYSAKSKMADTIGQYGNGFKTSTMRLGADVIVFSRCCGKGGERPTQSIGLLSYTFLRSTGKEDIVVPMLDYEKREDSWSRIVKSTTSDWNRNVDTIIQWSPFSSEADLLQQFNQIKDQGTRIIIYNLWEDDQGLLELDFDTDPHDIQIRGVNRDEKSIEMAQKYPNSRHFLTYRHSLRNYAAILYLRIPAGFRIILRGKDAEHHNIVNDMMMSQEITYRPQPGSDGIPKNSNLVAVVTVGFVKDAKAHIDVQGFNVYHKNRLVKPFWRVWHPPGSDGRGVIGVLEANFVEPAHDKQGFERTIVLSRLEQRLIQMQKTYWSSNCHKIGYAPRRNKMVREKDPSPADSSTSTPGANMRSTGDKGHMNRAEVMRTPQKRASYTEQLSSDDSSDNDDRQNHTSKDQVKGSSSSRNILGKGGSKKSFGSMQREVSKHSSPIARPAHLSRNSNLHNNGSNRNESSQLNSDSIALARLEEENRELKERLKKKEEELLGDLLRDLQIEKERCKSLEDEVAERKNEELMKEQESLIEIFSEERQRRDTEEEDLRQKIKVAASTIEELLEKVKWFEKKQPKRT